MAEPITRDQDAAHVELTYLQEPGDYLVLNVRIVQYDYPQSVWASGDSMHVRSRGYAKRWLVSNHVSEGMADSILNELERLHPEALPLTISNPPPVSDASSAIEKYRYWQWALSTPPDEWPQFAGGLDAFLANLKRALAP